MIEENKEIDLIDLIKRIFTFLKEKGNAVLILFVAFIRLNIKHFVYVVFAIVLGIALGYYLKQPSVRTFYADFTMQVNGTNSYTVSDIVKVLGQSLDLDDNPVLSEKLNIKTSIASKVKSIQPYFVIDLNNNKTPDYIDFNNGFKEDSLNSRMKDFLVVRLKTAGLTDFDLIQTKIIEYLRADTYLKREENQRIKILQNRIVALDKEIEALDNLRLAAISSGNTNYTLVEKGVIKETTYYNDMIHLKLLKSDLVERLELQPDVVTIYSGVAVSAKYSDKLIFIFSVFALYLFAFILICLIRSRKKIADWLKTK